MDAPNADLEDRSITAGDGRRGPSSSGETAVSVRNVSKRFRIYHERNDSLKVSLLRGRRASYEEFLAVDDVSFDIRRGETFGIVGQNGSGKSTLLKCLARILRPDSGTIEVTGKVSALLELGAGFHPELSGRENVYLNGSILGLSTRQLDQRFDEIVEFAGLERFIDTPVKNYSSGMYVRLGFSVAINVDPDVLLIDEVLAVGDEEFQRRCTEKFAELQRDGRTIVVVSHGLNQLRGICDRLAWLRNGRLEMVGDAGAVVDTYLGNVHVSRLPGHDGVSTRWGSGEAEILAVEVLGPDGQPTGVVRTGDRCTFRVRYRVNQGPIDRPCIGFAVRRIDGIHVTGVNNREQGMIPRLLEGEGCFDYVVDPLPLLPATYELSYAIQDEWSTHTYDWWQDGCRFDVAPALVHETEGILTMFGRWEQVTAAGVRREPEPGAMERRRRADIPVTGTDDGA
jgi:ABC-2 type transport system ATP-binding protein